MTAKISEHLLGIDPMPPTARRWTKEIKLLRARAAFADIAAAAGGIWLPRQLEEVAFTKATDQPFGEVTNKFGKMIRNGAIPDDTTVRTVATAFPGCNIRYWLNHPLVYLLDTNQDKRAALTYAFDSIPGALRPELWREPINYEPWTGKILRPLDGAALTALLRDTLTHHLAYLAEKDHIQFVETGTERAPEAVEKLGRQKQQLARDILRLEQPGQLDHLNALTLITALAKYAQDIHEALAFERASQMLRSLFPNAIAYHPQLLFSVKLISKLFYEQILAPANHAFSVAKRYGADPGKLAESAIESAVRLGQVCPPSQYIR